MPIFVGKNIGSSFLRPLYFNRHSWYFLTDDYSEKQRNLEKARMLESPSLDDPPTTCCMSGCANCVYIVWADALTKKMIADGPVVAEKILSKVQDPNMKEYLKLELRMRGILK